MAQGRLKKRVEGVCRQWAGIVTVCLRLPYAGRALSLSACDCHMQGDFGSNLTAGNKVEYVPPCVSLSDFSLFSL